MCGIGDEAAQPVGSAGALEKVSSRKSAITGRVMICKTLFLKATLVEKRSHHLT